MTDTLNRSMELRKISFSKYLENKEDVVLFVKNLLPRHVHHAWTMTIRQVPSEEHYVVSVTTELWVATETPIFSKEHQNILEGLLQDTLLLKENEGRKEGNVNVKTTSGEASLPG